MEYLYWLVVIPKTHRIPRDFFRFTSNYKKSNNEASGGKQTQVLWILQEKYNKLNGIYIYIYTVYIPGPSSLGAKWCQFTIS